MPRPRAAAGALLATASSLLAALPVARALKFCDVWDEHEPAVFPISEQECLEAPQVYWHFPQGDDWRVNCSQYQCSANSTGELIWASIRPSAAPPRWSKPKLAILVMAVSELTLPEVWSAWMANAKRSNLSFRLHIHVKSGSNFTGAFRRFTLNQSVITRWCKVVDAEWLLMQRALQDPEVTHLAMVSPDAVPVKSLAFIYRKLRRNPATRLCIDWTAGERAETWWLMARADAELLVQQRRLIDEHFRTRHKCEEERTWMRPLVFRSFKWGQELVPLLDECVMFTDWGRGCHTWASHSSMANFTSLRRARHTEASAAHPRTYFKVNRTAVRELERSPFWWARKFAPQSLSPKFFSWA